MLGSLCLCAFFLASSLYHWKKERSSLPDQQHDKWRAREKLHYFPSYITRLRSILVVPVSRDRAFCWHKAPVPFNPLERRCFKQ